MALIMVNSLDLRRMSSLDLKKYWVALISWGCWVALIVGSVGSLDFGRIIGFGLSRIVILVFRRMMINLDFGRIISYDFMRMTSLDLRRICSLGFKSIG